MLKLGNRKRVGHFASPSLVVILWKTEFHINEEEQGPNNKLE